MPFSSLAGILFDPPGPLEEKGGKSDSMEGTIPDDNVSVPATGQSLGKGKQREVESPGVEATSSKKLREGLKRKLTGDAEASTPVKKARQSGASAPRRSTRLQSKAEKEESADEPVSL